MKGLRALLLLAGLVALFLYLDPRSLPPRVTPPQDRVLTVNGLKLGDPAPSVEPEGVHLKTADGVITSIKGTQLEEKGQVLVRAGSTRDEVDQALGGPDRTLTGEWRYPGPNFQGEVTIEFSGDDVLWVGMTNELP